MRKQSLAEPVPREVARRLLKITPHVSAVAANKAKGNRIPCALQGFQGNQAVVLFKGHKRPEVIETDRLYLSKSQICGGRTPILRPEQYEQLFVDVQGTLTNPRVLAGEETVETTTSDPTYTYVLMDRHEDFLHFYRGSRAPKDQPFTKDVNEALTFKMGELNAANRTLGKLKKNAKLTPLCSSPDNIEIMTVSEVAEYVQRIEARRQKEQENADAAVHRIGFEAKPDGRVNGHPGDPAAKEDTSPQEGLNLPVVDEQEAAKELEDAQAMVGEAMQMLADAQANLAQKTQVYQEAMRRKVNLLGSLDQMVGFVGDKLVTAVLERCRRDAAPRQPSLAASTEAA